MDENYDDVSIGGWTIALVLACLLLVSLVYVIVNIGEKIFG